ncbi:prostaglandin reductase 1-like [Schistocerca cancellata]|uniref:prostaglandin reductase 1-like n=1 Tax=Schistocerca cancellata TaxID=274614 RepID=UPI0021185F04|nr:prostaglandin reductase 1-like [Schistocerca cancellata]
MSKARKFVITRLFKGDPRVSDFKLDSEDIPALQDGQILCEAEYISVDPYQRAYTEGHGVGRTMIGSQRWSFKPGAALGPMWPVFNSLLISNAHWYSYTCHSSNISPRVHSCVGSQNLCIVRTSKELTSHFRAWGWRDRTVVDVANADKDFLPPMLVPDLGGLPLSLSLGVLGMPGATAYFGLLHICDPKPGEVVVVSGAAGAVGSIAGQIARIKGCRVIGIAGSDVKVKWVKNELGFDQAFNYNTVNLDKALKEAAPDGVDVYFNNVGGEQSSAVIANMRHRGRIAACGCISVYNGSQVAVAPVIQMHVVSRELRMEGFVVARWSGRWDEAFRELGPWIREGRLKYRETVTDGFVNTPQAFIGMLRGENLGKAVVKV